jgi:hypothetical protein
MGEFENDLLEFAKQLGSNLNGGSGKLEAKEVKTMRSTAVTQEDRKKLLKDFFRFKLVLNVRNALFSEFYS